MLRRRRFAWLKNEDTSGNVSVIFALCLCIIVAFSGGVFDIAAAYYVKSKVQNVLDNAVAQVGVVVKAKLSGDNPITFVEARNEAATTVTDQLSESLNHIYGVDPKHIHYQLDVRITDSATSVSRSVSASASADIVINNHFLGVLGIKTTHVKLSADVGTNLPTFINVNFLIDTSQSMGIGGNSNSIKTMMANKDIGCMFSCHDRNNHYDALYQFWNVGDKYWNNTWLYIKCNPSLNISTRLDDAKTAISQTLDRFAHYHYNKYAATLLTYGATQVPSVWSVGRGGAIAELQGQILPQETCPSNTEKPNAQISYLPYNQNLSIQSTTNNFLTAQKFQGGAHFAVPTDQIKKIVDLIDIEERNLVIAMNKGEAYHGAEGTDTDDNLFTLANNFSRLNISNKTTADGSNAAKAKQIVILITDGGQYWDGWQTNSAFHGGVLHAFPDQPVSIQACALLKNYVTLAVVYVPPVNITDQNNPSFRNLINSPPYDVTASGSTLNYRALVNASDLTAPPLAQNVINRSYNSFISLYGFKPASPQQQTAPPYPSATQLMIDGGLKSIVNYQTNVPPSLLPHQIAMTRPTTALTTELDAQNQPIVDVYKSLVPFEYNLRQCASDPQLFYKVDTSNSPNAADSARLISEALIAILSAVDKSVVLVK